MNYRLIFVIVAAAFVGCGTQMQNSMTPTIDPYALVYGAGSAGAKTVSANEDWSGAYPADLQFTDFTVNAGITLTVPSGTLIRCTGTFTNNGTIKVLPGARGGNNRGGDTGLLVSYNGPPEAGVALAAAVNGDVGSNAGLRLSGDGGVGIGSLQARLLVSPGAKAGGGGGTVLNTVGAAGGGSFKIVCRGAISNTIGATIEANGDFTSGISGQGGAGGGIIIFASATSVTNNGTMTANGSAGGDSSTSAGPGGGGGGGIVHLISPTISQGGGSTVAVNGGGAGSIVGMVNQFYRSGGGGGGACRGNGGNGGFVPAGATIAPMAAVAGLPGELLLTQLDPTTLLLN